MKVQQLFGAYEILRILPGYAYFMIWGALYGLLLLIRKIQEGVAYQVSASAFLGDIALTIFVYTGATMINSGNFDPIGWLGSQGFHWVIIGVALVCSLVYYKNTKPKYLGDVYHAVVILPLFMYFILVLVPVYYYYCSFSQGLVGLGLLLFWVLSVVYDMKEERLDQRKWIKKNRPNWTLRD